MRLPSLSENDSLPVSPSLSKAEAVSRSEVLVERLKRNPNDPEPREELALLLAGSLNHPALAIEQMELLLEMPGIAENRKAEWLAQIATWQHKQPGSETAARDTLNRISKQFPASPQARAARRKIQLMDRANEASGAAAIHPAQAIRIRVELPDPPQISTPASQKN